MSLHTIVIPPNGFQGVAKFSPPRNSKTYPAYLRNFCRVRPCRLFTLENKIDYLCSLILEGFSTSHDANPVANTMVLRQNHSCLDDLCRLVYTHFGVDIVIATGSFGSVDISIVGRAQELFTQLDLLYEFLVNPHAYIELNSDVSPPPDPITTDRGTEPYFNYNNVIREVTDYEHITIYARWLSVEPPFSVASVDFWFDSACQKRVPTTLLGEVRQHGALSKVICTETSVNPLSGPSGIRRACLDLGFFVDPDVGAIRRSYGWPMEYEVSCFVFTVPPGLADRFHP